MFAIYNKGNVGFRSTADNLYELKNLEAPNEARLKPDDDTLFQNYLDNEEKIKSNLIIKHKMKLLKLMKKWQT